MISIPIVDPDFESQPISGYVTADECGMIGHDQIAGWTVRSQPGAGGGVVHWTCDDGMPPSNVAFIGYGASMYQVLNEVARGGVYVLQFDVADWVYAYPGDWKAELYQGKLDVDGNLKLSPAPFCSGSGWALGDMKRQTVTCNMHGYFTNSGADALSVGGQIPGKIVIFFTNGIPNPALGGHSGWPILIDNVSLTFTPTN